jgi:serine/threonine protein kinase
MQEQIFEGRYQLLAELANTRSYVTFRAFDQIYKEKVDIQIYGRPSPSLDAKISRYQLENFNLFLQNAQQLKRLNEQAPSDYFQPVIECNVSTTTNQVYIVYKHIEDTATLGQIVSTFPKTTPGSRDIMADDNLEETIREGYKHIWILEQAAVALDYANQKNVPHNNISMNAFLVQEVSSGTGTVWLTDFDLSSSTPNLNSRLGQAWSPYVSPEQRNGYARERTSDIYAFAAVIHEMVFGLTPTAPTLELPDSERESVVSELIELFPKAKGVLANVFGKALRYNPQRRYSNALEFIGDLKKAFEIWMRDWTNYRVACLARLQGDYEQCQNAAIGLYTLDRLNREAWNSSQLQEELNARVAAMSPVAPLMKYGEEMVTPPPGVVVEGFYDSSTETGGDVFEYRNDDQVRSTAIELRKPQDLATVPTLADPSVMFRPGANTETGAKTTPGFLRNVLMLLVPLGVLVFAGLIIALFLGGDNLNTPTSQPTAGTPINLSFNVASAIAQSNSTVIRTVAPTVSPTARAVSPTAVPPTPTLVLPTPTPTNFQINLNTGLAFLQQGNFGAAKDTLQKALAEQPENKEALRAWNYANGGIYLAEGDFNKAVLVLESVYKESPNFFEVQPNLQTALIGLGDSLRSQNPDSARRVYRQASTLQGTRKDEANQKATELGG